jgi:hypothetical protein
VRHRDLGFSVWNCLKLVSLPIAKDSRRR